jgi:hypothetical protein
MQNLRASILITCLMTAATAAADPLVDQVRDVSDFTGVVFSGTGDLHITQGDTESLSIRAEQKVLDVITTSVRGGVLTIGRKPGRTVHTRAPIRFDLQLQSLERLGMSGSGDVFAGKLEGDTLKISVSGSSDVELGELLVDELRVTISGSGELSVDNLSADHLETSISGSGTINVEGTTHTQDVSVSGSGDHKASKLESASASATVVGSGKVEIWVTDALDVTVTGSGDVEYRGSPQVTMQVMGSGTVKAMGK